MSNPFKTGRSRTLKLSGTISTSAILAYQWGLQQVSWGLPQCFVKWFLDPTATNFALAEMLVFWDFRTVGPDEQVAISISVAAAINGSVVTNSADFDWVSVPQPPFFSFPAPFATTSVDPINGTISMTMEVEEWCSVYTLSGDAVDTYGFPKFGGGAADDGLTAYGVQFYELPVAGTNLVVSISVNGVSATNTALASSLGLTNLDYLVETSVGTETVADGHGLGQVTNSIFVGVTLGGVLLSGADTWTAHDPDNGDGYVSTVGGVTVTSSTVAVSGVKGSAQCSSGINWSRTPDLNYSYNVRLRSFTNPYPGSLTVDWQNKSTLVGGVPVPTTIALTAAPNASATVAQRRQGGTASPNNVDHTIPSAVEWCPMRSWIDPAGFSGEDSRDWRLQFRGFSWPALSLSHASSLEINDCSSPTGWVGGANTSLDMTGVVASASGGTGSVSYAVDPTLRVWEAWRYLQITGSCTAATTLTVGIAGQTWDLAVGTSSAAHRVDLCCATSETETAESKQSRFPIVTPGGFPDAKDPTVQYKLGWGVDFCDSLTISGIPDGETLTLADVSLVLAPSGGQRAVTFLEPFLSFQTGWTDPSDTTYVQPFALLETDFRVSDWPGLAHVVPTSGTDYYRPFTIAEMCGMLRYPKGMTVTQLADPSDTYHASGLEGLRIAGSGSTYDWGRSGWTDWLDVDISATKTVLAQDLWDEVIAYPGAGQVWTETGAYGATIPLQVSKYIRGQAWGLDFDLNGLPVSGGLVKAYVTSSGAIVGTANSGALGNYLTGLPYGVGNVDTTTKRYATTTPSAHSIWQNRLRTRTSFRAPRPVLGPRGYDVSYSGIHTRTSGESGMGDFWIGIAGNGMPRSWVDIDSGVAATWARPRFEDFGAGGAIGVFYGDGTNCYWARTYDQGATWLDTTSLGAGVLGDYDEGRNGLRWFYQVVGSGPYDIYRTLLDPQLNVVEASTITNLTGVDNAPIAVRESYDSSGSWRIGIYYSTGGSDTFALSSDGLTFS